MASAVLEVTVNGNQRVEVICNIALIAFLIHCVSKNVTPLTCYNLYIHGSIAKSFGNNVAEKVGNQNLLYFPTSTNCCFCTTWGNRKPRNCVFLLKCRMLFTKKHETQLQISLGHSRTEQAFTVKTINWLHQTAPMEHSILLSVTHMHCVSQVCRGVSRCVKRWELFFVKPGVKVNGYLTISTNVRRYQTHHR